jgi:hypothetical protein
VLYQGEMIERCAESWDHLLELLYAGSWQEPIHRFRASYAYRGVGDARADLRTGLARLEGSGRAEGHLLRNFRKYASRDAVPGDSVWNWLALGQHHGLPTRLLDWTFSPLVALHFATQSIESYTADGAIWRINYRLAHDRVPPALGRLLEEDDADVFTAEMLARAAGTLAELDRLADEPFSIFFEPPSLDDRIVNQFALFSLMSSPSAQLEEWLGRNPDVCERIIVPAALKWECRDKLDQANITERVLFPGLDGLSRWLKRYYTPRT